MTVPFTDENGSPIEAVAVRKGDGTNGAIPVSGTVTPQQAGTATRTNVAGSNASTQLLAANASRVEAIIVNDSTAIMYVMFGSGAASATNYTIQLPGITGGVTAAIVTPFTGRIAAIWASSTGNARVTEETP